MWQNFLSAFALLLVFEGIMPFASPKKWKVLLLRVTRREDRVLRIAGFISMLAGVVLLTIIHQTLD